eukprot:TRINITY_DN7891_c0_g2_i1.p1 TRINITY_DN7891_c0_g2~~TRINITY_DN7891_c0_g2_i1.p1  ORF type:complete len:262 (-),score=46.07 TRINITY_DN7891_c0_g2_i1:761-1546(-)
MAALEEEEPSRQQLVRGGHMASISVMVASLKGHHMTYLRDLYYKGQPQDGSSIAFHQETADKEERWGDATQHEAALVEIFLLSFSTHLVISEWSTFGAMASALGGLTPWLLNIRNFKGLDWHTNGRSACSKGTLETCYHLQPENLAEYCPSSESVREETRIRYLDSCFDGKGLQVIPVGGIVIREYPHVNFYGGDWEGSRRDDIPSLIQCKQLCLDTLRCNSYSFSSTSRDFSGCWLKELREPERRVDDQHFDSGIVRRGI